MNRLITLTIVLTVLLVNSSFSQRTHWPDPVAQHVIPSETAGITHGPMLGRPKATSMRVWIRTARPLLFRLLYDTRIPLDAESPAVDGITNAEKDNTATVDLTGLNPNTRYFYGIEIDGNLADIRMDFDQPWPSFQTLPSAETFKDPKHNPDGLFNINFSIGCGGSQNPTKEKGGQYSNSPSFKTILDRHGNDIQFHFMNGDYTYEELRDGTVQGVRANYRLYMERGLNMSNLQRNVPWLFIYDDHEVADNLFGSGEPGFTESKRKGYLARDVQLGPWYEYAGWANYDTLQRGKLLLGTASINKDSGILFDPKADFEDLKPATVSSILVRNGEKANLGTYGLVKVLDKHRLQLLPVFDEDGEVEYSIGTHHYYDWKLANCHFFVIDTRGERSHFSQQDIRSPKQFLIGQTQRKWLLEGVKNTDADFIFIISSTGCVIPHSGYHTDPTKGTISKGDGFPGYIYEREIILKELDVLTKPVLFFTGDVHNSASVQITDNIWEFMVGPMNSKAHPIGTLGNMPFGGWYTNEGRKVKVKWVAGFPNDVHFNRLHSTFYGIVQVNNVFKTAKPQGTGYQFVAYDTPQVVVRFHDAYTGDLLYAEGISLLDVPGFSSSQ